MFTYTRGSAGYVTFRAYLKEGNDKIESNEVSVLIHPQSDESGGAFIQVLHRATRQPLEGASVTLQYDYIGGSFAIGGIANINGYVAFANLTPREYRVSAQYDGIKPSWEDTYEDNDTLTIV